MPLLWAPALGIPMYKLAQLSITTYGTVAASENINRLLMQFQMKNQEGDLLEWVLQEELKIDFDA